MPFGFAPASFLFLLTNTCLLYFLFGMFLGWVRPRCMRWIQATDLSAIGALGVAAAALCVHLVLLACVPQPPGLRWAAHWSESALAAVVLLAVGGCLLENAKGGRMPAGRMFNALKLAGDASYSSYLTHGFVMGPIARLLVTMDMNLPVASFAAGMVLACTAIGVLVHLVFEKPLLKRFSRPPWTAGRALPVLQAPSRSSSSGR